MSMFVFAERDEPMISGVCARITPLSKQLYVKNKNEAKSLAKGDKPMIAGVCVGLTTLYKQFHVKNKNEAKSLAKHMSL